MHLATILSVVSFATSNNEVPIIGILSQETDSVKEYFPDTNYTSFISASYVKFVESAGARAVPVWINQDEEYYRNVIRYTNGLLLPGGSANHETKNGYWDAGKILYRLAYELNRKGEYYPIIGICLGMEHLACMAAGDRILLTSCSGQAIALPIQFKTDFRSTKLFHDADEKTVRSLQKESLTYNNHQYCVTPADFASFGLKENWKIISTSYDKNGIEFISAFEHKLFPFYGLQFHPEKNIFNHQIGTDVPRSKDAIKVSQYFADFFVFESRRNDHVFPTWEEEHKSLIFNYQPVFINSQNSVYEQLYMFS